MHDHLPNPVIWSARTRTHHATLLSFEDPPILRSETTLGVGCQSPMKGPEHRDEIWLSRRIERTQPAPDGPERLKTADHTRCQVAVSVREGTIFYTKIIDMIVPSSVKPRG